MEQPFVSIFCLSYNQAKYIEESLESIKNQTYQNFEILICDDASADNSVEVIENWKSANPNLTITFIKHSENKGICKSLNDLLAIAKGKYIQMLALDDLILPDKLERHVNVLENSSDKDCMVFSDAVLINSASEQLKDSFFTYHNITFEVKSGNFHDILVKDNFIPAMSVLLKTDDVRAESGWDEELGYEDYDMWLRLSKTKDFILDKKFSCKYRLHESNSHHKSFFLTKSNFKIYLKHTDIDGRKEKLHSIIETLYLNKILSDEHKNYYAIFPAKTVADKIIRYKLPTTFYKIYMRLRGSINV